MHCHGMEKVNIRKLNKELKNLKSSHISKMAQLSKLLMEFYRYAKVRIIAIIIGIIWATVFVDMLNFSGLVTALLYTPIMGTAMFVIHKLKGAKF